MTPQQIEAQIAPGPISKPLVQAAIIRIAEGEDIEEAARSIGVDRDELIRQMCATAILGTRLLSEPYT